MPETNYRALCLELLEFGDQAGEIAANEGLWPDCDPGPDWLLDRARAALAQPEPVAPKPVVDYSRVPEIATEAQIRAAAQYLIKKQNCDGDLIPAIEYAIARWGNSQKILASSPQPEPAAPTDEEIMELMPQQMRDDLATAARAMIGFENPKAAAACRIILNRHAVDHARAVLARWGTPANNTREENLDG
jgi:hypothetical protein